MIKPSLKKLLGRTVAGLSQTAAGRFAYRQVLNSAMTRTREVEYRTHRFRFAAPNALNDYRIETFATKEPETLEWIDSIPEGGVLWDVGANIGLYSIYAAKTRHCDVYAFEPSVFNLELLARNIFLNGAQDRITICPFPLSDATGLNSFRLSTTEWGGALSAFGAQFDQSGNPLRGIFDYRVFGLAIAEVVGLLRVPQPQYVKIDVDGIEHFILRGARDVLPQVESVLIEINDAFPEQAEEATKLLAAAGLRCERKCDLGVPNMFNQWWDRRR